MPVRIPTYQDRLTPSGFGVVPQARGVEVSDAIGRGMQRLGAAGEDAALTVMRVDRANAELLQKKDDDDAIADAGKKLSDAALHWDQYLKDASQNAPDGAAGFTPKVIGEFDKYAEQTLGTISNERARKWASSHFNSLRTSIGSRAIGFEAQAGVAQRDENLEQTYQNLARLAAQDPSQYEMGRTILLATIANAGYNPLERSSRAQKYLERYAEQALAGATQANPEAVKSTLDRNYAKANPTVAGFESSVGFTLRHEGGYNPKDSNGAPAKFGINKAANPDVDLDKLTQQGAKDIYRQRYWNAIGGDKLAAQNPALATMAFDTAVMSGPSKANDLLAKSGGDPAKFMDLREQFLAGLVKRDPGKYGAYEKAWGRRNAELRQQIGGGAGDVTIERIAADVNVDRLGQFSNQAQTELNRQQATYRAQLSTTEGDHVTAWMNGDPVQKPLTEVDYVKAYGPVEGPQRFVNYQQIGVMGADIAALKLATPEQMAATVAKYKPQPNQPGYELATKRYDMVAKAADAVNQQRQADPMLYAQQAKIGGAAPLNFNDQAAFGAELNKRAGIATTMQQTYQAPYALLSKAEAQTLSQGFERMTTQQKVGYLDTIRRSVADPVAYRAVMQQIAPDSPVTAMSGILLSKQAAVSTSSWFGMSRETFPSQDVAAVMLEGEALMNPGKAAKGENGAGKTFPMPKEQELRDAFANKVGKAFAGDPNGAAFAFQAVKAYYAGKAARDGDVTGTLDSGRLQNAITAVIGGVSDINGNGEVLRPWGMDEALFKNAAKAAFEKAIEANGYKGTQLDVWGAYGLQSAGDSKYLVRTGTGYLVDKQGRPIMLDLLAPPPAAIPTGRNEGPQRWVGTVTPSKSERPETQQPKTK